MKYTKCAIRREVSTFGKPRYCSRTALDVRGKNEYTVYTHAPGTYLFPDTRLISLNFTLILVELLLRVNKRGARNIFHFEPIVCRRVFSVNNGRQDRVYTVHKIGDATRGREIPLRSGMEYIYNKFSHL